MAREKRELRIMKPACYIPLLVTAGAALGVSLPPISRSSIIECTELRIRDEKGRNRMRIGTEPDMAHITIFSPQGNRVCTLAHKTTDGTVTLEMTDEDDKPRILLSAVGDGVSQLELYERRGYRIMIGAYSAGTSGFALYDTVNRFMTGLLVSKEGVRFLRLADQSGKPRASLAVLANGRPILRMVGEDGNAREITAPDAGRKDAPPQVR
jgi:hypothetical protein